MALIDRQTLIDSFCSQCTVDKPETCSTLRYGDKWCNEVYTILNAPTVDAVPVSHGEWVWVQYDANPKIGNFHCSKCGFIPAAFNMAKQHLNYCPNCGARMDGKDGDNG